MFKIIIVEDDREIREELKILLQITRLNHKLQNNLAQHLCP